MEFTTKISDTPKIDIYGLDKHLGIKVDDYSALAVIRWSAEVEAREWGIKSIISIIRSVSIEIEYSYYEKEDIEGDNLIDDSFIITDEGFTVIDDNFRMVSDSLCPSNIEVNFDDKTITIE
jgi:hypothetical protein